MTARPKATGVAVRLILTVMFAALWRRTDSTLLQILFVIGIVSLIWSTARLFGGSGQEEGQHSDRSGEFDLVLDSVGNHVLEVRKLLRETLNVDYPKAKSLTEDAPVAILARVSEPEAQRNSD
jgi:hypothetical protein